MLLFRDGHPQAGRWRISVWLTMVALVVIHRSAPSADGKTTGQEAPGGLFFCARCGIIALDNDDGLRPVPGWSAPRSRSRRRAGGCRPRRSPTARAGLVPILIRRRRTVPAHPLLPHQRRAPTPVVVPVLAPGEPWLRRRRGRPRREHGRRCRRTPRLRKA